MHLKFAHDHADVTSFEGKLLISLRWKKTLKYFKMLSISLNPPLLSVLRELVENSHQKFLRKWQITMNVQLFLHFLTQHLVRVSHIVSLIRFEYNYFRFWKLKKVPNVPPKKLTLTQTVAVYLPVVRLWNQSLTKGKILSRDRETMFIFSPE